MYCLSVGICRTATVDISRKHYHTRIRGNSVLTGYFAVVLHVMNLSHQVVNTRPSSWRVIQSHDYVIHTLHVVLCSIIKIWRKEIELDDTFTIYAHCLRIKATKTVSIFNRNMRVISTKSSIVRLWLYRKHVFIDHYQIVMVLGFAKRWAFPDPSVAPVTGTREAKYSVHILRVA